MKLQESHNFVVKDSRDIIAEDHREARSDISTTKAKAAKDMVQKNWISVFFSPYSTFRSKTDMESSFL